MIVLVGLGLPYWAKVTEAWSWPVAAGAAVVLLAAGLSIYRNLWPRQDPWAPRAIPTRARLQFNHGLNLPTPIQIENIWYWYAYFNVFAGQNVPHQWTVFLVFERLVTVDHIDIDAGGAPLPVHEVKTYGNRHAVIYFGGDLSGRVIGFRSEEHT